VGSRLAAVAVAKTIHAEGKRHTII